MTKLQKISVAFPSKIEGVKQEKDLADVFDELVKVQGAIDDVLDGAAKTDPMPTSLETTIKARRQIAVGRNAELKDLKKARGRKELHTNPTKLKRLYGDLSDDIAPNNALTDSIASAVNDHYEDNDVKALKAEIKDESPNAYTLAAFKSLVKEFVEANKKERWAKLQARSKALKVAAAELERVEGLKALRDDDDFKVLKQGKRESIVNAAIKNSKATVDGTREELVKALETQDKPSKSRWANHLELGAGGSYTLKAGGSYDGYPIHVTMSNDSWTPAADGLVSIKDHTADQLLEKILKSVAYKQLHATLEIGKTDQYPHIYLFAGVDGQGPKWAAAAEIHKANLRAKGQKGAKLADSLDDADWIAKGQAALTAVLETQKQLLLTKLRAAKNTGGAGF